MNAKQQFEQVTKQVKEHFQSEEPLLDTLSRSYEKKIEYNGMMIPHMFGYNLYSDHVKITHILFGGWGSGINVLFYWDTESLKDIATEIYDAVDEEENRINMYRNQLNCKADDDYSNRVK